MTKKLVSFDDQAEPGEGLPAAVKTELNATYGSISDVPLTPFMFGAAEPRERGTPSSPIVNNDSAIQAMWAYARTSRRPVMFPVRRDGKRTIWDYYGPPLETFTGMRVLGEGIAASTLYYRGTGPGLFHVTEMNHYWNVERISIAATRANVDVFHFEPDTGISIASFKAVFAYLEDSGPASTSRIWNQSGAGDHIQVTWDSDCVLQAPASTNTIPYRVRSTNGGANCSGFYGTRINGLNNPNRPFIEIDSDNPGAYANDWVFQGLVGEQNVGGLIRMKGAQGVTVIQSSDEDATVPYTGDIFSFVDNDHGLASDNITLIQAVRRGSSVSANANDIRVSPSARTVTVIACNPTPSNQAPKLVIPGDATVIGTRDSNNVTRSSIQGFGRRAVTVSGGERRLPLSYNPDRVNLTNQSLPKDEVRFMPLAPVGTLTIKRLAVLPVTAASGGTAEMRFGLWSSDQYGRPNALQHDFGNAAIDLTSGAGGEKYVTLPGPVAVGWNQVYWIGCWWTGTATSNPVLFGVDGVHPAVATGSLNATSTAYRQATGSRPNPAVPDQVSPRAGIMVWAHL